jgi:hypothetical protein
MATGRPPREGGRREGGGEVKEACIRTKTRMRKSASTTGRLSIINRKEVLK